MSIITLLRINILWLFFISIDLIADDIRLEKLSKDNYSFYNIDINKDGVLDKVASEEQYGEGKLYFFVKTKRGYKFVHLGSNFTYDGIYFVENIKGESNPKYFMSLSTKFYGSGGVEKIYFFTYKENTIFPIEEVIKTPYHGGKIEICHYLIDKDFHFDEKSKKCKMEYYFTEDSLDDFSSFVKESKEYDIGDVRDIERYQALLKKFPFNKNTLTTYNNIAYYLQKAGANKEAVYLLEKILKKYPKRMVAYYNLGDAYWALGQKKKAVEAYITYIEQMCDAGKQKRIPKVIKDRVSSK